MIFSTLLLIFCLCKYPGAPVRGPLSYFSHLKYSTILTYVYLEREVPVQPERPGRLRDLSLRVPPLRRRQVREALRLPQVQQDLGLEARPD